MSANDPQTAATRNHRRGRVFAAVAAAFALVVGLLVGVSNSATAAPAAPKAIISLTFDDGIANQLVAADAMKQYGMVGTFYANSGFVGSPGFLTLDDIKGLAAYGNEIGSHSISHPDLATISADEAARQICNDRVNWSNWGIPVRNFAYPFASSTTAVEALVKNCGNNSARGLGDIKSPFSCPTCPAAETIPPADPYFTKAPDQVETTWTLADLKQSVTQAEANGGWVQLTFHSICDACADPAVSPAIFKQFVAWLAPRLTSNSTQVKTVGDVIGGTAVPAVAGPVAPPAAPGVNGIKNPSMETFSAATGLPECYIPGGSGSNTPTWKASTDAHTGTGAVEMTVADYVNGDAKLVPTLDLGECAPSVVVGQTYTLSEWYKSTANTQFDLYYRNGFGTWAYWTSSPWFGPTTTYTEASWVTPAVPDGATAVSFGLNLFSNGTLITDDASIVNGVAAPPAALRSPTLLGARSEMSGSFASGPDGAVANDPQQKGALVTKHYLLPDPTPAGSLPDPAAASVVPNSTDTGRTFVISPEATRG